MFVLFQRVYDGCSILTDWTTYSCLQRNPQTHQMTSKELNESVFSQFGSRLMMRCTSTKNPKVFIDTQGGSTVAYSRVWAKKALNHKYQNSTDCGTDQVCTCFNCRDNRKT